MVNLKDLAINKRIAIYISLGGIGDKVIFSSFPENFYKTTGIKLIDSRKEWVFDKNPYVLRDVPFDIEVDLTYRPNGKVKQYYSNANAICEYFGIDCYLRHPSLYIFDDIPLEGIKIAVHTSGRTCGKMPNHIIQYLKRKYENFPIIQVGHVTDEKLGFGIDITNESLLSQIKNLASSSIFIGVNSGFMHLASCYPRIHRRIIVNAHDYSKFIQLSEHNHEESGWIDVGASLFNPTDRDLFATYSYLKI